MPSDERESSLLQALSRPLDAFRSALAATHEQATGILDGMRSGEDGKPDDEAARLGAFSAGLIDVERFTALVSREPPAKADASLVMESARATLAELLARKDDLYVVDVPSGTCVRHAVGRALEEIGRAFGAARVIHLAQTNRYVEDQHAGQLAGFPFARWSRAERALAPALVVKVDGADLAAERLASFLDGSLKLVFDVRGRAAPAPLVRLVTPRTFVAQAEDAAVVRRLGAWNGPGAVGLIPEGAARFVHDPAGGNVLASRLTVEHVPDQVGRDPLGGLSAAQMADELAQLTALAEASPAAVAAGTAGADAGSGDPADKLAAWLLRQADLGT